MRSDQRGVEIMCVAVSGSITCEPCDGRGYVLSVERFEGFHWLGYGPAGQNQSRCTNFMEDVRSST